jgi:hypothetical protein
VSGRYPEISIKRISCACFQYIGRMGMYLLNLGRPKYANHSEAFPKGKINQERAKQPERYMFAVTPR